VLAIGRESQARVKEPSMRRAGVWGSGPTVAGVFRARSLLRHHLSPTPLREYPGLADLVGTRVLIKHENLIKRFKSAVDFHTLDARAEDLPKIVKNLNTIERDCFIVPETRIALPDWI